MPVDQTTALNITCDNPDCPGNDLDPTARLGWLFVSSEVYGEPTQTTVFCSYGCVGTAATAREADPEARPFNAPQQVAPQAPAPASA